MPRGVYKRKKAEEDFGDEAVGKHKDKTQRASGDGVGFAATVQGQSKGGSRDSDAYPDSNTAVSFGKLQHPRSILKSKSESIPIAARSSDAVESRSPEPSEEPEVRSYDTEEVEDMSKLAAAAMAMSEKADKERLEKDLATALKELESTKEDFKNIKFYEKALLESRDVADARKDLAEARKDVADARKQMETTKLEHQNALLAISRLKNKLRTVEGRVRCADKQAEKLEQELSVVRAEKAEMEKSLGMKIVVPTADTGIEIAK